MDRFDTRSIGAMAGVTLISARAIANIKFSATFTYLMEELGKIQTPSR